MNNLQSFSTSTTEAIKYYVYALVNDVTNKIEYIGKGKNQRVFESLKEKSLIAKHPLRAYLIRHNLTEAEAFLVEATLIDLLPYFSFSTLMFNAQDGLNNRENSIASITEIENQYSVETIDANDFRHNVLIVSINKSINFQDSLVSPVNLYECTRKAWVVNIEKVKQIDYVIAKHNGILKEIYKPHKWYEYPTSGIKKRFAFEGDVVIDSSIRELYLNKKIEQRSYGQPIIYITNKNLTMG